MVNRKDSGAFLTPLLPYAASITLTEIENEATSYKAQELAQTARALGFPSIHTAPTPKEAVTAIAMREKGPARILITGSLFLIGNILRAGTGLSPSS